MYFVFRSNEEVETLFDLIEALDTDPDTSKRAITHRALLRVIDASAQELKDAALQRISGYQRDGMQKQAKIPVDADVAEGAREKFINAFDLERPQVRFMMRVALSLYYSTLREEIKSVPSFDVRALRGDVVSDPWLRRMFFSISDYAEKDELLHECREYLEQIDTALWERIRAAATQQVTEWSKGNLLSKYGNGQTRAKTNILLHSKVLAGAILMLCEDGLAEIDKVRSDLQDAICTGEPL